MTLAANAQQTFARLDANETSSRGVVQHATTLLRRWAVPILILVWSLLALLYATGPVASDDFGYLEIARAPSIDPWEVTYPYARFGFWYPLNLVVSRAHDANWAFLLLPMLGGLAALTALYRLVAASLGRQAGVFALLSLGCVPLFVTFSTISLPDTLGAALLTVSLLLVARPLIDREASRPAAACLAGGFIAAFSFCIKETVILLCPALFLFVLLFRTRKAWAWRRLGLVAAGAMIGLGADMAVLAALTGDPLFHLKTISAGCRGYGSPLADHRWSTILWYVTDYVRLLADPRKAVGPWGVMFLAGVLVAFRDRHDLSKLALCCVLVIGGYLSVGTVDFASYFPIYHQSRYIITLLPLGAILAARLLDLIARHDPISRRFTLAVVGVSVMVSLEMPNATAGKAYYAATVAAATRLFNQADLRINRPRPRISPSQLGTSPPEPGIRLPDGPAEIGTVLASADAVQRVDFVFRRKTHRPLTPITTPAPETPEQWIGSYGGSFVLVTPSDRRLKNRQPDHRVLSLKSIQALSGFPLITTGTADHDRLHALAAAAGITQPATNPHSRVDLYRIPTALPQ